MSSQNRRLFISAVVVVAVSIFGGWLWSRVDDGDRSGIVTLTPNNSLQDPTIGTNKPVTGKFFPDISLRSLTGDELSFSSLRGIPYVVNFWYSTCEPCKRELPALVAASQKYGDKAPIIGVNPQDSESVAREFATEYKATYTMLRDPNGDLLTSLGIGIFPMTIFVDAGGVIAYQHAGEITAAEIDSAMTKYLAVK